MTNPYAQRPEQPAVRFNGTVEYRIEGDYADLRADLAILNAQLLDEQFCTLQLWACNEPVDLPQLQGTKVAEIALDQTAELAGVAKQSLAMLPAGQQDYTMVMALVGHTAEGDLKLHDYAVFNNRQLFNQPRLQGEVTCRLNADRVELFIESILNSRDEQNQSGSLSLELWALNAPYSGGAFSGFELAQTELGTLNGGYEWRNSQFNLALNQPPAGEWSLVLMLREWTPVGYVTRDFRQLQELVCQPEQPPVSLEQAIEPIAAAEPVSAQAQPAEVATNAATEAQPEPAAEAAQATPQTTASTTVTAPAKAAPKAKAAPQPAADKAAGKTASKATSKAVAKAEPVSVNRATAAELAAVKGLSERLAESIVANRPFTSLDELLKVRGVGARMLAKLRDHITL